MCLDLPQIGAVNCLAHSSEDSLLGVVDSQFGFKSGALVGLSGESHCLLPLLLGGFFLAHSIVYISQVLQNRCRFG
jgi:hypothetical protein